MFDVNCIIGDVREHSLTRILIQKIDSPPTSVFEGIFRHLSAHCRAGGNPRLRTTTHVCVLMAHLLLPARRKSPRLRTTTHVCVLMAHLLLCCAWSVYMRVHVYAWGSQLTLNLHVAANSHNERIKTTH